MRHIDEIIIHCSATKPNWMQDQGIRKKVEAIRDWHVNGNGWSDIGYHYVIDRNGEVRPGRSLARAGAHTKGHNSNSIGICLIGGYRSQAKDSFEQHYTEFQRQALMELIQNLEWQHPAIAKISGHNEYANKGCPGFQVKPFIALHEGLEPEPEPENRGLLSLVLEILRGIFGGKG